MKNAIIFSLIAVGVGILFLVCMRFLGFRHAVLFVGSLVVLPAVILCRAYLRGKMHDGE